LIQTCVFFAFFVLRLCSPVVLHTRTESVIRSGPIIRPGQTSTYASFFFMRYESFCCSHCVRQTKLLSTAWRYITLKTGDRIVPETKCFIFGLFFISLVILNHQVTNSAQGGTNIKEWPLSFVFVSACGLRRVFFLKRTGSKRPEMCRQPWPNYLVKTAQIFTSIYLYYVSSLQVT
jgi:FlaA1/EpsC-like NDP-sugar epimerase